uniref:Keratin, type I cytoskeletal 13-like n=1 Tax=Seriola lalandi dorsalis TaxID=1841481 RepID=A0A3B4X7A6_SERLL
MKLGSVYGGAGGSGVRISSASMGGRLGAGLSGGYSSSMSYSGCAPWRRPTPSWS